MCSKSSPSEAAWDSGTHQRVYPHRKCLREASPQITTYLTQPVRRLSVRKDYPEAQAAIGQIPSAVGSQVAFNGRWRGSEGPAGARAVATRRRQKFVNIKFLRLRFFLFIFFDGRLRLHLMRTGKCVHLFVHYNCCTF